MTVVRQIVPQRSPTHNKCDTKHLALCVMSRIFVFCAPMLYVSVP